MQSAKKLSQREAVRVESSNTFRIGLAFQGFRLLQISKGVLLICLSTLIACSEGRVALEGKWVSVANLSDTAEFFQDGTAIFTELGSASAKWSVLDDGRIKATLGGRYGNMGILIRKEGDYIQLDIDGTKRLYVAHARRSEEELRFAKELLDLEKYKEEAECMAALRDMLNEHRDWVQPIYAAHGCAKTHAARLELNDMVLEIVPGSVWQRDTKKRALNSKAWLLSTTSNGSVRNVTEGLAVAKELAELEPDCWELDTIAASYAANRDFNTAIEISSRLLEDPECEGSENLAQNLASLKRRQPILELDPAQPSVTKGQIEAELPGEWMNLESGFRDGICTLNFRKDSTYEVGNCSWSLSSNATGKKKGKWSADGVRLLMTHLNRQKIEVRYVDEFTLITTNRGREQQEFYRAMNIAKEPGA